MRAWIRNIVALLALLAAFGAWGMVESNLGVPPAPQLREPKASPPPELSVAAIVTGESEARAIFVYRGGSPFEVRKLAMGAFVVRHPRGTLVFDAGLGSRTEAHVQSLHPVMRESARFTLGTPLAAQLKAAGVTPAAIVLTHAHWDHVSGLDDLRNVPVWVSRPERDFIRDGGDRTALARSFGELPYVILEYPDGPYLGYPRSRDVWGDGSVVIVPAPGHTPGSLIAFVTLASGVRYALVGDLVWQKEGIDAPAERPWPTRFLVDWNADLVRSEILHMHHLARRFPSMIVVPAHDARVWAKLPKL